MQVMNDRRAQHPPIAMIGEIVIDSSSVSNREVASRAESSPFLPVARRFPVPGCERALRVTVRSRELRSPFGAGRRPLDVESRAEAPTRRPLGW
jgi:hypothetical protein